MAIVGTEFSSSDYSADLAFFDTRNTNLLAKFTDSHGDDVTEVKNIYCSPVKYRVKTNKS